MIKIHDETKYMSLILCEYYYSDMRDMVNDTIKYLATEKLDSETWDRIYSELQNSISDLFNARYKYEQMLELCVTEHVVEPKG